MSDELIVVRGSFAAYPSDSIAGAPTFYAIPGVPDLAAAQAEIAALKRERDMLAEEIAENIALFYLIGEEVAFMGSEWEGDKWIGYQPCLLCNDTFGYACADAEEVPKGSWKNLLDIYKEYGADGLVAWMALRRGCDPISPLINASYKKAKHALQSDAQRK